jgi:hypothetical protein
VDVARLRVPGVRAAHDARGPSCAPRWRP